MLIIRSILCVCSVVLIAASANAQKMSLGPWKFTGQKPIIAGNVDACTNNAPAGTFWGGRQNQPVLKAFAQVHQWWRDDSICVNGVDAEAPLNVGKEKTEVELECVIYGHREIQAIPARSLAVGFASIVDGQGQDVVKIGCAPKPMALGAITPDQRAHDTQKTSACLDPKQDYLVKGDLDIQALIGSAWFAAKIAKADFTNDDGNGLPSGLMLIIQARGTC